MDANGTRFHLLLGRRDWSRAFLEDGSTPLGAVWSADEEDLPLPGPPELSTRAGWLDSRTQELTLRPRLTRFLPSPGDRPVALSDRRGAARDRYGNWYVVDADRARILVRSSGADEVTPFWPPSAVEASPQKPGDFVEAEPAGPVEVARFDGLVVTQDHRLVTIARSGARTQILVFDLFAGGPPRRLSWPDAVPLETWDLAPRSPGGFWLLDRSRTAARLWELNASFQVVRPPGLATPSPERETFEHVGPDETGAAAQRGTGSGSAACDVARVTEAHALVLEEREPIAIEPLPGGGVLVLDARAGAPSVVCYRDFVRCGEDSLDEILDVIDADGSGFELVPHDFAVLAESFDDAGARLPTQLFVADRAGNQAFCFELELGENGAPKLTATSRFFPLRLFGGRGLVTSESTVYYDGFSSTVRFVPLVAQDRPRYEPHATIISPALDGDTPECVWHRVVFEGCVPSDTGIRISTRATDAGGADLSTERGRQAVHAALDRLPWYDEPLPVRRGSGSELPWLRAEAVGPHDTWELLVQRARGRYLQLRIVLTGDGRRSPRVRALRAYFPRFSYLANYLPACYRDDPASASFVERWLANHEGITTMLEDRALELGTLCDPAASPAEFLDWLGRWYAVYLDPAWPPARKRLFLRHALTFFRWRGTPRGLRMALRLAFDDFPDDRIFAENTKGQARYRLLEGFRARILPAKRLELPACPGRDEPALDTLPWQPEEGRAALDRRWEQESNTPGATYPLSPPGASEERERWAAFSDRVLGFVPRVDGGDDLSWRRFLRCRYASFSELRTAWRDVLDERWNKFEDVGLPTTLPASLRALDDWAIFHRVLKPMRAAAHRFSVWMPVCPQRGQDDDSLRAQLHVADRLIALEKPAHTAYRVHLYWALFRVGTVRLGADTQLGKGSRVTEVLPPLRLGAGALAETRLSPRADDWNRGRLEVGRNPLGRRARPAATTTFSDIDH